MLRRLFAGAPQRKTRFHDELGNRIGLSRVMRNLPAAVTTGIARLVADYRGVRPWISYDAQKIIKRYLTSDSRVLEFGSGMSTAWYASNSGAVVSVEDYEPWFEKVRMIIARSGATNVTYVYAHSDEAYIQAGFDNRGDGFDLIMIDGSYRDGCVRAVPDLLRRGGMVYLDNSDKGQHSQTGDIPAARIELLKLAQERGAKVDFFTDFAPTQLFAQQGLMVRFRD